MSDRATTLRAQFDDIEAKRAEAVQTFKAMQAELQKANNAVSAADVVYRAAGVRMKNARERLDSIEAQSAAALKELMEVERR